MDLAVEQLLKLIEKRTELHLACVFTCPGPKKRRSDAYLKVVRVVPSNIDVIVCNRKKTFLEKIKLYKPDLLLSIGYPWLLPEDLLKFPPLGALNFHNSHLPDKVGPNAFGVALINGDDNFKFCSHRMDGTFDTGAIMWKETMPIAIDDYLDDESFWTTKVSKYLYSLTF
uniref:Formyl transferase N-terminal domain-containing protein n=1 Tax=Aplanochytrium stocchinoi TaxID=215587 RepID=A0A7S3LSL4_9STRA